MTERTPLSKRTRFEIFKRDGFRCIYCGATPQDLPLHVDHVVAVANGGTDDPHNLVTACRDCNGGKSAVPLEQRRYKTEQLTEADRDHAEQIREYLRVQREVFEAKNELGDELVVLWEQNGGREVSALRSRLARSAAEFGFARIAEAIELVAARELDSGTQQIRYFYGILRRWREPAPVVKPASNPAVKACEEAIARACAEINEARKASPRAFSTRSEICQHVARAALIANGCPPRLAEELSSDTEEYGADLIGMRLVHEFKGGWISHLVTDVKEQNAYEFAFGLLEWLRGDLEATTSPDYGHPPEVTILSAWREMSQWAYDLRVWAWRYERTFKGKP